MDVFKRMDNQRGGHDIGGPRCECCNAYGRRADRKPRARRKARRLLKSNLRHEVEA
jgi:hypothetical protein